MKQSIAIFDFSIISSSPAGSCVLQLIKSLSSEYQFFVFADKFENPDPQNIVWIRVPIPKKPVILRYIAFKYLAPIYYKRFIQSQSHQPDLIMSTEGEFSNCDICYVHFCHRAYLNKKILKLSSLRSIVRFLTHQFNANSEAAALSKATTVVVPSPGLAEDLIETYDTVKRDSIVTISNPLDVEHFTKPETHQSAALRKQLGFSDRDIVLAFTALGNFEHKGLNIILQALANLKASQLKLLVIGGSPSEINKYAAICKRLNISTQVNFVGFQTDIRPYLWLSDLFILPSLSETFSLATFQAAIAGLPMMTTQLDGVTELLEPGVNGWLIERSEDAIAQALQEVIHRQRDLPKMGDRARNAAAGYGIPRFVAHWEKLLAEKLLTEKLQT